MRKPVRRIRGCIILKNSFLIAPRPHGRVAAPRLRLALPSFVGIPSHLRFAGTALAKVALRLLETPFFIANLISHLCNVVS
jgi:hypothetical protein